MQKSKITLWPLIEGILLRNQSVSWNRDRDERTWKGPKRKRRMTLEEKIFKELMESIILQREEILTAFLAKYGLQPDEVEQVEQIDGSEIKWYVKRREAK